MPRALFVGRTRERDGAVLSGRTAVAAAERASKHLVTRRSPRRARHAARRRQSSRALRRPARDARAACTASASRPRRAEKRGVDETATSRHGERAPRAKPQRRADDAGRVGGAIRLVQCSSSPSIAKSGVMPGYCRSSSAPSYGGPDRRARIVKRRCRRYPRFAPTTARRRFLCAVPSPSRHCRCFCCLPSPSPNRRCRRRSCSSTSRVPSRLRSGTSTRRCSPGPREPPATSRCR